MTENVFFIHRKGCKKPDAQGRWRFEHGPFALDEQLSTVECRTCGERLTPMAVLLILANKESRARAMYESWEIKIRKIAFQAMRKNRVKCSHCGKLTCVTKETK